MLDAVDSAELEVLEIEVDDDDDDDIVVEITNELVLEDVVRLDNVLVVRVEDFVEGEDDENLELEVLGLEVNELAGFEEVEVLVEDEYEEVESLELDVLDLEIDGLVVFEEVEDFEEDGVGVDGFAAELGFLVDKDEELVLKCDVVDVEVIIFVNVENDFDVVELEIVVLGFVIVVLGFKLVEDITDVELFEETEDFAEDVDLIELVVRVVG
jgi:hypothetical protein